MNQAVRKQVLKYLVCVLLAVITIAAYASVVHNLFIVLDDRDYILKNAAIQKGFSWNAIKWAFTAFYANNWHPLTWLSHTLDCTFYGLNPTEPHLVNLAFHATNTILLFLLLLNLTTRFWASAFVAVLFALHPMHVESVAWVSERKDVLSTFFFLLTLLAYGRYVELSVAKKPARWPVYGLALLLFALGLLAKAMLVTLPCILILLDFWPLRRFQLPLNKQPKPVLYRLLIEKIPFFFLSAACCWVTFHVQNNTGAVRLQVLYSVSDRFAHLPIAYAWYVLKCFWPSNLSVYYLLRTNIPASDVFSSCLLLLAITAAALFWMRKFPWFIVGWLWFIGTLVPVIGLVQVGNQAYADRYAYIPYIGLFICLAWGIPQLLAKWSQPRRQVVLAAGAALVVALCFWRTVVEAHYWINGPTLFSRAIAVDPKDEFSWMLLGLEFENQENFNKAEDCLKHSIQINDQFNLGWYHLGKVLVLKGDYAAAIENFQTALSRTWFSGDKAQIYSDMGDAYMASGQTDQAIDSYQNSLALNTLQPGVQDQLGKCFLSKGQTEDAKTAFQDAIKLQSDYRDAHLNLAMLLGSTGHDAEAIPHYREVIALDTNVVLALNNLAWILAADPDPALRNGKEAVPLAEHACERANYQQAFLIGTLAAAYAEAGRFNDAVAAAQKAHDVALAHGQKEIADKNLELMQLYKAGKPFHMDATPPPSPKPSP